MHHIVRLFCPRLLLLVNQVWRFNRKPENGDRNRERLDVANCGGHISKRTNSKSKREN